MNVIEIKHLTKRYDGFILDNVNLTLPSGTIMGLVGENGAGKSTAIKLIMDSIPADQGSVSVFGIPNTSKEFVSVKQDIGVVLDEAYFPEVLTAKNIHTIMKGIYINWNEQTYFDYIQRFGLPTDKKFKDYSRGMKMKLAISVALSHNPKLLILDEATSGLDPMIRDEILDVFHDFTRNEHHSILLSSHIISDLEKVCDYIAFIHKGKLVLCEEKDLLLENYVIIKVSDIDFQSLSGEAIISKKKMSYGYDILVMKHKIPTSFRTEKTSLEDIILFLSKGDFT